MQNSDFCLANKFKTEILILHAIKWCIYDASQALLQPFCQYLTSLYGTSLIPKDNVKMEETYLYIKCVDYDDLFQIALS